MRTILRAMYSHRNGTAKEPEMNGWYWCVWLGDEAESSFIIPMEWVDGDWYYPHGKFDLLIDPVVPSVKPHHIYGPLEVPHVR